MIKIVLSIDQKISSQSNPSKQKQANTFSGEAVEKNRIIILAANACPYHTGDIVYYNIDEVKDVRFNQEVKVIGIAKSIFQFGKDEEFTVPPRIVCAQNTATGETFFCTTNCLRPKNANK